MRLTKGVSFDSDRHVIQGEQRLTVKEQRELEERLEEIGNTIKSTGRQLEFYQTENKRMREALELISKPVKDDGTWNVDREACQQIAKTALKV